MKRWTLRANTTGPDALALEEVPVPEPGADKARVKVHAVSLNFRDQIILNGDFGQTPPEDIIPVSDGAGVVDAVGSEVEQWSVGDRVVGIYLTVGTTDRRSRDWDSAWARPVRTACSPSTSFSRLIVTRFRRPTAISRPQRCLARP